MRQAVEAAARKAAAEEADAPMPDADGEEGALPGPPAGARMLRGLIYSCEIVVWIYYVSKVEIDLLLSCPSLVAKYAESSAAGIGLGWQSSAAGSHPEARRGQPASYCGLI